MADPDYDGRGPFRTDQLRSKGRYELDDGHAVYCAPADGNRARSIVAGTLAITTDPDVEESGIDPGYELAGDRLRAPDLAVGAVPDAPGWIKGRVPPLAVEYAGSGQDEIELKRKIADLLQAGTRWIWVVRLVGPRRVDIHTNEGVQPVGPGQSLTAPGVLRNPVAVEALYEPRAAHEVALRNLLQRQGYDNLDAVRDDGRQEGRLQKARTMLLDFMKLRFPNAEQAHLDRVQTADETTLDTWTRRLLQARTIDEVFADPTTAP